MYSKILISGRLVEPADDKPRSGVTLSLFSVKNSGTVLKHATYRCTTGGNGEYSFNAAPGSYDVAVSAYGSEPERVGRINVYEDSPPGSLNSFLLRPDEDDFTPEIIRIVQALADSASASSSLSTKEANRSKAEADRAKSEADRAKQISGLGTVEDAIALAAVPFPDVWIPFNDSLRMFAGHGREVKVGSDVVARMVNVERSTTATYIDKAGKLRTAAINESRLERNGLLVEGNSTNLIVNSSSTGINYNSNMAVTNNSDGTKTVSNNASSQNASGTDGRRMFIVQAQVEPNTTYTFSALCSGKHLFSAYGSGVGEVKNAVAGSEFGLGFASFTFTSSPVGGALSVEFYGGTTSNQLDFTPFIFVGYQLETLPFASSYIPTNGTAVTRAADKCWIPSAGNRFAFPGYSLAFEWDIFGVTSAISDNRVVDLDNSAGYDRHYIGVSQSKNLVAAFGTNKVVSTEQKTNGIAVLSVNEARFSLFNDGVIIGTAEITNRSESANNRISILCNNTMALSSFGHIRNLRAWHLTLSASQARGLK